MRNAISTPIGCLAVAILVTGIAPHAVLGQGALPRELRNKKLIDAGLHTQWSIPAINSQSLRAHPNFTRSHPFDGMVVRALLGRAFCVEHGLEPNPNKPAQNQQPYLDAVAWSTRTVPEEAVRQAVADLQSVQWGSLTDNFLWYQFRDGNGAGIDIAKDQDWAAVEENARVAAHICRSAGLKGIFFDTEQYGYAPLKSGTAEMRRKRGRQWISAVQTEAPGIKVMFSFAWCKDLLTTPALAGVKDFLNGILDEVEPPTQLINAYENTFYYGHAPQSRFTKDGFRGDRARYEEARRQMQAWQDLSTNPEKYRRRVQVGMAAWLEDDPWSLTPGWPSGHKHTVWSNVPLALATSEEYVWCWSEHTSYLTTHLNPAAIRERGPGPNPFLASLTNQTFNTGTERTTSVREDFTTDPLRRGWYFDFDILKVARRKLGTSVPIFSRKSVPYVWSRQSKVLQVVGTSPHGTMPSHRNWRGQRYVHPIQMEAGKDFQLNIEFEIQQLPTGSSTPIVMGLFDSDKPLSKRSLALQIKAKGQGAWTQSGSEIRRLEAPLQVNRRYRLQMGTAAGRSRLKLQLTELPTNHELSVVESQMRQKQAGLSFDEVGVALTKKVDQSAKGQPYRYTIRRVDYRIVR